MNDTGVDVHGFNPFPAPSRFPGIDYIPGPLSQWTQSDSNWLSPTWNSVPPGVTGPRVEN